LTIPIKNFVDDVNFEKDYSVYTKKELTQMVDEIEYSLKFISTKFIKKILNEDIRKIKMALKDKK
jgi:hypothetical protein